MGLIVEDGTGLADADSYLSLVDAELTFEIIGSGESYLALADDAARELALRQAKIYIDTTYDSKFSGSVKNGKQSGSYPRVNSHRSNGQVIGSSELPRELLYAVADAAESAASGKNLFKAASGAASIKSESVSIGVITESKTYALAKEEESVSPAAETFIKPLLTGSEAGNGGSFTVERA